MSVLLHPFSDGVRIPPIVFSTEYERRTLAEDRDIIDRIIAAYHSAMESASSDVRQSMFGTIWEADGFAGRQAELLRALHERSAERTHAILRRFHASEAAFGIALGASEAEAVRTSAEQARSFALIWLDRLVGLAHASGALPSINPEDNYPAWQRMLEVDPEEIADAIEQRLGVSLAFPNVTGVFGPELRGSPIPFIAFTHLLVALQLRPWLPADGGGHAVEIGGGFGGLAMWTARLLRCRYTIYDLPFANAAQAYFLSRALPGHPLRLAGEPAQAGAEIALLPGWMLLQQPPSAAHIVVNQDSLPEIPRALAADYLKAVRGFLTGVLLSVNHESWQRVADRFDRTSVAALIAAVGGYTRLSRAPFALRVGYVQEIYVPSGATLQIVGSPYTEVPLPEPPAPGAWARVKRLLSRLTSDGTATATPAR